MKNKKTFWTLLIISLLLSWLSWLLVFRSLYWAQSNYWFWPIISLYFCLAFLSLYIIIEDQQPRLRWVVLGASLPALILAKSSFFLMLLVFIPAFLLILEAVARITKEKEDRLRIHPRNIIRLGIPLLNTSLALLIAGGYYFSLEQTADSASAPKFKIEVPSMVTDTTLHLGSKLFMKEQLAGIENGITVDEFILQNYQETNFQKQDYQTIAQGQLGRELTVQELEALESQLAGPENNNQQLVLARENIAKQFGVALSGQEKMKDVIREIVNQKIEGFFSGQDSGAEKARPLSFALALFLTVKSLAWLLSYPLSWTIAAIFHIMVKMKVLNVEKVMKEVEVIV